MQSKNCSGCLYDSADIWVASYSNRSVALVVAITRTLLGLVALFLPLSLSRAGDSEDPKTKTNIPIVHDGNLKAELVAQGLNNPTSMRFSGNDTILVLKKNRGQVRLVDTAR